MFLDLKLLKEKLVNIEIIDRREEKREKERNKQVHWTYTQYISHVCQIIQQL